MRHNPVVSRAIAGVFAVASSLFAGNAVAGDFDQSSTYSVGVGMAPGEENMGANGSTRDANGNRVFINGLEQGVAYPVTDNANTMAPSGSTSGVGSSSATAIGNALNVTVNGAWNTVIVNSKQTNNGNQTATTSSQTATNSSNQIVTTGNQPTTSSTQPLNGTIHF